MLSSIEIQKIIPHRYPFLLVDKILEVEPGVKAVGIKNVTANEPFFQGHFPGYPVMPGVLVVEALAQTAGIAVAMMEEYKDKLGLFAGIEDYKMKRQVVPGDTVRLEAEIISIKLGIVKAKVNASVEEKTVAEGIIKFAMAKV
ncbi:MAG: 3-hydroxyacyl-ACP dehydratase FabZ [Clostridiales bacterium]|nr:3-hydroxyacyl-ACP dehydratase FabZ [Clostridiales bacterium]